MGVRAHVFPPENVLAAVAVHVRYCVQACREARKQTARRETPALVAAVARPATAERAWRGATGDEDAVLARPERNIYDVVEKVRAAVAALEGLDGACARRGASSEETEMQSRGGILAARCMEIPAWVSLAVEAHFQQSAGLRQKNVLKNLKGTTLETIWSCLAR
jgi:hypothetical protein